MIGKNEQKQKTALLLKITKSEKEYNTLSKNNEIAKSKITELTNINNFIKNKIFKEEKSFKEDIEKLKGENKDLIHQLQEIKKKEIELNDIKNKLRKYMNYETNIELSKLCNSLKKRL